MKLCSLKKLTIAVCLLATGVGSPVFAEDADAIRNEGNALADVLFGSEESIRGKLVEAVRDRDEFCASADSDGATTTQLILCETQKDTVFMVQFNLALRAGISEALDNLVKSGSDYEFNPEALMDHLKMLKKANEAQFDVAMLTCELFVGVDMRGHMPNTTSAMESACQVEQLQSWGNKLKQFAIGTDAISAEDSAVQK